MSMPISACMVIRSINGDEKVFEELVRRMDYNLNGNMGIFTQFPCECDPKCGPLPTDEQLEAFHLRLTVAIAALVDERRKKNPPRPIGKFDKWAFPAINKAMPAMTLDEVFGPNGPFPTGGPPGKPGVDGIDSVKNEMANPDVPAAPPKKVPKTKAPGDVGA